MQSEFQYRTPTSPASDSCISVTCAASSSTQDGRAPLDTTEETDSTDDLHKNHSAGLQIVGDRQRRLAERDGMLELI